MHGVLVAFCEFDILREKRKFLFFISFYLFICLFIYLFIYLFSYLLTIYLFIYVFIYLCIYLFIYFADFMFLANVFRSNQSKFTQKGRSIKQNM